MGVLRNFSIVAILLVLGIFLQSYISVQQITESMPEPSVIQAISAAISVFFSFLLYLIYRKQTQIKRVEQKPIIHANTFKAGNRDNIIVKLSNHGRGSATDIKGRVITKPIAVREPSEGERIIPFLKIPTDRFMIWCKNHLPYSSSIWLDEVSQDRTTNGESEWKRVHDCKLGPGEKEIPHKIKLSINTNLTLWPDKVSRFPNNVPILRDWNEEKKKNFSSALERISNNRSDNDEKIPLSESVDHYHIIATIEYKDPLGKTNSTCVFNYVVPAIENHTLEDSLEVGFPYEKYKRHKEMYLQNVDSSG